MNANATFYNFELRNYECESKKFERKPLLVKLVKWFKLYATTNKLSSYMKWEKSGILGTNKCSQKPPYWR